MTGNSGQILGKIAAAIAAMLAGVVAQAQISVGNGIVLDKDVHDFGDIISGSGAVSCSFKVTNKGDKPVAIYSVISSCGCTGVDWTREPLLPGRSGSISATYSNDEGPVAFDKDLTVYFSGVSKPCILKLRGVSRERQLPVEEIYTTRLGALGFRTLEVNVGQIRQGLEKSGVLKAVNLTGSKVKLEFSVADPLLDVKIRKAGEEDFIRNGIVPAKAEIEIVFTVRTDRKHWGKNTYTAIPVVGAVEMKPIKVFASSVENFDSLTEEQRRNGSRAYLETNNYSFGIIRSGTPIHAEFTLQNTGKSTLRVYKCDTDARCYSHSDIYPVRPGESGSFRVHVDTSLMPKGETVIIVTLTTNSPLRPLVNLFITGVIE